MRFHAMFVAGLLAVLVLCPPGRAQEREGERLGESETRYSTEVQALRSVARTLGVPEKMLPRRTLDGIRARKQALEPWEQKIASIVLDRYERLIEDGILTPEKRRLATAYATRHVPIDAEARLLVECKVQPASSFDEAFFKALGGELVSSAPAYGLVVAWIPADVFASFAQLAEVRRIVDVGPGFVDIGTFTTEGDGIHNAATARALYGVDGDGQTVGVISDGVSNLAAAQASGDLPPVINVIDAGSGDEGTAMLEIVADLAPGAALAFHTGFPGSATMITAINSLVMAGATVITDDLPFPREPVFEDGPIAQAKQAAFNAGVFYTASAGNRGNEHFQANFGGPANVTIGGNTYNRLHDFSGGDVQLGFAVGGGGSSTFYLQWAEPFGAAGTDLDLFILDNAGNVLASSTDVQNGNDDPIEVATVSAAAGTNLNVVIELSNPANSNVFFDLRAFGSTGWRYLVPQGSINGASRQNEVYAAAAAPASNPGVLEGFSSRGPIMRFFPSPTTRMKPDGTTVDGVTVSGAGGFGSGTCPGTTQGDCLFFGTSAATPHVAGLAALLRSANGALTPEMVARALNDTATDIDAPGPDNNSGYGRLDIQTAIQTAGLMPIITIPGDVYMPDTCVGQVSVGTLMVCNTGMLNLLVNGITSSDPAFMVVQPSSGYPVVISPDFCFPFQVLFSPTSTGPQATTFSISSNDPLNSLQTAGATGTGVQAEVSLAGSPDFGTVCLGESQDIVLYVCNNGQCPLQVTGITLDNPEFTLVNVSTPFTVGPFFCYPITLRYTPADFGTSTATLNVSSVANNVALMTTVVLTGDTPPPDIAVTGSTAFGDVCFGTVVEKTISVCNTGVCPLDVTSVTVDCPDFTLVNNPFPGIVAPGACLDVVIQFTPTAVGPVTCNLTITSNDPDEGQVVLQLTGNTPVPSIDVPPDLCFLPTVIQSVAPCYKDLPFPISNTGLCDLEITDISITSNATEYSLVGLPSFPIVLAPGGVAGQGGLMVRFAPQVLDRDRPGQISVTYVDDPIQGTTTTVTRNLNGEGVLTGARVLITVNGVPAPVAQWIGLQRLTPAPSMNLDLAFNAPLQNVTPLAPCPPFSYHREYGTVSNPVQLQTGNYQVLAMVLLNGQIHTKTTTFSLSTCDFDPNIVIDFP